MSLGKSSFDKNSIISDQKISCDVSSTFSVFLKLKHFGPISFSMLKITHFGRSIKRKITFRNGVLSPVKTQKIILHQITVSSCGEATSLDKLVPHSTDTLRKLGLKLACPLLLTDMVMETCIILAHANEGLKAVVTTQSEFGLIRTIILFKQVVRGIKWNKWIIYAGGELKVDSTKVTEFFVVSTVKPRRYHFEVIFSQEDCQR